ncbi:MAG: methyltransferase domain-containing protein [Ornithinimicrobium sp.]|uniref:class I SAM-dependent methyltransferase n=1 Tax=Ornithinimicrobium sp. TaxID=1977084 RepID=UPI0026E112C9|nr:methyltransferase domain-containing protein [Ornithinimicrobium sp.]MDO5740057.1 methyltransferase domain-containing protein [Ornithinimicrobium sp.]
MDEVAGSRTFTASGDAYDSFMGRYSIALAPLLADLGGVVEGQRVVDVGCGPGALTAELVLRLGAGAVVACDPSPAFLAACRERHPGVDVRQGRAEALPLGDDAFDAALAQLVLHFVSDAETAALELRRVVRPSGRVAVCVWDFEGGMQMLRAFWDAAVSLDPDAPDELHTMRFGRAGELSALLAGAGFTDVSEHPLTVRSDYTDFEELWTSLLLGIGPAGAHLVALPPQEQERLRAAYLHLLGSPAGGFALTAVARAAVGTVPA